MGFMNYEFPHSNYYNDDLRELIRLYHELTNTYNGLEKQIQELLDYIDNFKEETDKIVREQIEITMSLYTQRLKKVEKLVADLSVKVERYQVDIDRLDREIFELNTELRNAILMFRDMHERLLQLLHEYKEDISKYVDGKVELLEQYIIDNVTHLDRLDVINPISHKFEDINKVLEEIYLSVQLSFGITAREYDKMRLTAFEYDYRKILAIDYSSKGYFIFWEMRQGLMRSPFTGKMTHYSNIIYKLADLHKCTFTAGQYDDLEITARDYDAWAINAYNYDWFGRQFILKKEGVTAGHYDEAMIPVKNYDNAEITAYRYDTYGKALIDGLNVVTCKCMSCNPDALKPIKKNIFGLYHVARYYGNRSGILQLLINSKQKG